MPNLVRNVVHMEGIASLPLFSTENPGDKTFGVEAAVQSYEYFDFQKLLPIPESLLMPSGYEEIQLIKAVMSRIAQGIHTDHRDIRYAIPSPDPQCDIPSIAERIGVTPEEAETLGMAYLLNALRHGHTSWYGWCKENWGTKWNSSGLERIDDDTIAFNTADANPEPVIVELSVQNPDRQIEHWWAEEDVGVNTGYRCIQDGQSDDWVPPDCGPYALENYVKCWGMDDRLERTGGGTLRYIGD